MTATASNLVPLAKGNESSMKDEIQQLVRQHVQRNGYSIEQIAAATGHEPWAIEGCFSQSSWALSIGMELADALGLRLKVVAG